MKPLKRESQHFIFWLIFYEINLLLDATITFIVLELFPQFSEGNPLVNTLTALFGVSGGLLLFCLQESVILIGLLVFLNLVISKLGEIYISKSKQQDRRMELAQFIVVRLFIPYLLIASGVIHLFGTISWILVVTFGTANSSRFISLLLYITLVCCLIQSILVISEKGKP